MMVSFCMACNAFEPVPRNSTMGRPWGTPIQLSLLNDGIINNRADTRLFIMSKGH